MKLDKLLNIAVVFILGFIGGETWPHAKNAMSGKKEYVVLTNGRYSVQAFTSVGAEVTETLKHQDGFVAKITEDGASDLELQGFEVYENRVYKVGETPSQQQAASGIFSGSKATTVAQRRRRPFPWPRRPGPRPRPEKCEECPECPVQPTDPEEVEDPKAPIEPTPVLDEAPWGTKRVQAVEAMAVTQAKDIKVCIIDTGIDSDHPDLVGTFVGGRSFVAGNASFEDDQGHGTHVAGTVAAISNNGGITGVSQASLYIVKSLDRNGSGTSAWIADGIDDCTQNKVDIISMSLGSPAAFGPDRLIAQAVERALEADIYVFAAAGNDRQAVNYPAALEGVEAVSASDRFDRIASFSSRGPRVDLICPGVDVKSARMGGGYVGLDGTSMATPHCAAIMALTLSAGNKDMVVEDLGLTGDQQGRGMPNALKSVSQ